MTEHAFELIILPWITIVGWSSELLFRVRRGTRFQISGAKFFLFSYFLFHVVSWRFWSNYDLLIVRLAWAFMQIRENSSLRKTVARNEGGGTLSGKETNTKWKENWNNFLFAFFLKISYHKQLSIPCPRKSDWSSDRLWHNHAIFQLWHHLLAFQQPR